MFHRLDFEGAKCHWVWQDFVNDVIADLKTRGYPLKNWWPALPGASVARYDVGGFLNLRHDKDVYFELRGKGWSEAGAEIVVLNKHVYSLRHALTEAPVREGGYVKLHGHWTCTVISETHAKGLLEDVTKWLKENE